MSQETKPEAVEKLEFQSLDEVLSHLESLGHEAEAKVRTYRHQVKELTGHDPSSPVTPLDVVRIVRTVFRLGL